MESIAEVLAHIESNIGRPPGDFSQILVPDYGEAYHTMISADLAVFSKVDERNDRNYDRAYILGLSGDFGDIMLMLSSMGKYACLCRTGLFSTFSQIDLSSKCQTPHETKIIEVVRSHGYVLLSAEVLGQPTNYVSRSWFKDIDGPMQVCHVLFSDSVSWFDLDEFKST